MTRRGHHVGAATGPDRRGCDPSPCCRRDWPRRSVEGLIAVVATATDAPVPAGTAAMAIGFALSAGVLPGGPASGGGNPVRALGPISVAATAFRPVGMAPHAAFIPVPHS